MPFRIYLVEDEENVNQLLVSYLRKEGWDVVSFLTGEEARQAIHHRPDLWILDIMLPDIDGYQLIREIKADSPEVPVIFISARDAELDRVIGLEMGSDDYLAKPFLPRELVIRTRKLLERVYGKASVSTCVISLPPYSIDESKRMVMHHQQIIELTSKEFDFLLLFAKNQGQAFSREQILKYVWGEDYFGTDRVVDDIVRRIRKKMPDLRIETIYGYGYRVVKQ
ncbi:MULTISPECIES: response regulator transcription factor [Aneurinibacillus]|uniref:Response regulator transcription factor n=1 Tax=Aneurinibacillus thermoaerophilus TaxID=143495 RepID=A0A1G8EZ21_ANETH|nr:MULTISPECIES: response regulator transcription factor [Aneurinibacillus]AMA71817.1 two-component system response regulator [Aneurinibacillus sp. XH2]MED0677244.1 response regulator transcription factor [Aneurinibacillus thermoaerophilus]MED0680510.1 response regulator transcription factor [Aneurinibacillus thermoaerophilus]MED0738113.1 response regulator transcription factor [Aneurinibacillus thermoaerophilus]MED0764850.1 response regulator transcription factor [Aneurinibacillus thermoaerop